MSKKLSRHTFLIIFTLIAAVLYDGHTDDWPDNDDLPSSVYASTHGEKEWFANLFQLGNPHTRVHVHCIAAAHWDRDGYYNLWAQIEEAPNAPWWVFLVGRNDNNMNLFEDGCREFASLWEYYDWVRPWHLVYKARAFIKDETTGAKDGEFNQDGMVMED